MKRTRKLLAGLTATVLLLTLLPTTALAAPQSSYTSESGITVNVTPLPAELAYAKHIGDGVLMVEENDTYTFYDVNGNKLGTGSGYDLKGNFNSGLAPVSLYDPYTGETAYSYINKTGSLAFSARFQDASAYSEGIAWVELNGKNLYIDTNGMGITTQNFGRTYDFHDGVAVAQLRSTSSEYSHDGRQIGHYVVIDKSGNIVGHFPQRRVDYEPALGWWYMEDTVNLGSDTVFRNGYLPVTGRDDEMYLMDKTGALRSVPGLNGADIVACVGEDRVLVSKSAMWSVVTMDGSMILPYLYSYSDLQSTRFEYNISNCRHSLDEEGIIDINGNIVVPEDWGGIISKLVDGMAVGREYNRGEPFAYLFWASDSPCAPGASGQKPQTTPTPQPTPTPVPETPKNLAYASTQTVTVDGKAVEFQMYALKDANGNDTNYVKLRDVAATLNGTPAQFEVSWDGAVNIVTGQPYTPNGSEMSTPFTGDRAYTVPTSETKVNGSAAALESIVLTDDSGNGYTYYKLRDLGTALGFTVDWSAEQGVFIQTN